MNRNWQSLLLFLIAVGFPVMRAVLQAIARQREAAKAEQMKQKQVEESLRTGKGIEPTDQQPPPPADALEARRRAQLEELRRRGRERAAGAMARIPGSPGPTVPMPTRPGRTAPARSPVPPPVRPTARQTPPSRPAPTAGRPVPKPSAASRRQQQKQSARPSPPPPRVEEAEVRRLVPDAPISSLTTLPPARAASDGSPEVHVAFVADWRRALILKEILDPPMALRDESDGGPPAFSA